jgi:glucose-1-phosphate cytidylyltransferase
LQHAEIPVFIPCGGLGIRVREETEVRPKAMVPVRNYPIVWKL